MYNTVSDIPALLKDKEPDAFQASVLKLLTKFKTIDPLKLTYRVHRRSVRALQNGPDGKPINESNKLLAKNCALIPKQIEYPDNVVTKRQRKEYLKSLKASK